MRAIVGIFAATVVALAQGSGPVVLPQCSATRTTNCTLKANASGNVPIGATVHDPATSEPTCNSGNRGHIVRVNGGAGVADTYRQCVKDATDAYAWAAFGGGGGGTWGSITGTLASQTDLNAALVALAPLLLNVVANTGDGTISAANLKRSVLTNTGASGAVVLTLGTATCTVGSAFTVYVTAPQTIKLIPYTGDQIMTLTSAINHSITSDAVVGSFVSLSCLATGKWFLTGLNGAWTDTL